MADSKKLAEIIDAELKNLSDEQLDEVASFARYLRLKSLKAKAIASEKLQKSITDYTTAMSTTEMQHLEEEFAGYQTSFPKK